LSRPCLHALVRLINRPRLSGLLIRLIGRLREWWFFGALRFWWCSGIAERWFRNSLCLPDNDFLHDAASAERISTIRFQEVVGAMSTGLFL
jgi:hypothetical protein